jgi:hypothetical protein
MILHRPTLRRAEPIGGLPMTNYVRVKVLGTGAIETWKADDALELPKRYTDEELRLALALKLSIADVRSARRGCDGCERKCG